MTIDIIFSRLPPALDGIGDHTALLASALSCRGDVRVLTAEPEPLPIAGVAVERVFDRDTRRSVLRLVDAVAARRPDWVVLQFNQFSYGRWGLNPYLPRAAERIAALPGTRLAWLAHEHIVPADSPSAAVMSTWQRAQFRAIGRAAHVAFFTIQPWVDRYRDWFPGTPVYHLPVGSNLPLINADRAEERARLGIGENEHVLGVFGSGHPSRQLSFVAQAARALVDDGTPARILYIGGAGNKVRAATGQLPLVDLGRLDARDVSRSLRAVDMYLAPFELGVSTRRGSFMAGIQHGLPTVSTSGSQTDDMLKEQDGTCFVLTEDGDAPAFAAAVRTLASEPVRARELGRNGQALYDRRFRWDHLADRLIDAVRASNNEEVGV